jgi:hypothetical protein
MKGWPVYVKPPLTGTFRAETEGFEPSEPVRVLHLSRVVH